MGFYKMIFGNYLKRKIMKNLLKIGGGCVKFFGKTDFIMFPASGMACLLQQVYDDFGEQYLFDLGYEAGVDGSKQMFEDLNLNDNSVFLNKKIILSMFESLGFGKLVLKVLKPNQGLLYSNEHPVVESGMKMWGVKSRVCAHYRGIFSIHTDKEFKVKGCKFVETQCVAHGAPYCEWSYNYFKNPKLTSVKLKKKKLISKEEKIIKN
jgi:hypothetical protein